MGKEWRTVGVAVEGVNHERLGRTVEDKVFQYEYDGIQAIALCDGVGSAEYAAEGASLFSEEVCYLLTKHFDLFYQYEDIALQTFVIEFLLQGLTHRFGEVVVKDYAATLLCVAVKGDDYILLHLGDGVIGCLNQGSLIPLSEPTNFEFVNRTVAVTSSQAVDYLKIQKGKVEDIQSFFLMSDGSETSLYDSQSKTFADILIDIINLISEDEAEAKVQLEELIRLRFRENTGDDCSLNLMVRNDLIPLPSFALSDFLELSSSDKNQFLKSISKDQRKSLSVRKIERIMKVLTSKRRVKRLELRQLSQVHCDKSFRYVMNLLVHEDLVGYDTSRNEFYMKY